MWNYNTHVCICRYNNNTQYVPLGHSSTCFTCIFPFNSHNSPMTSGALHLNLTPLQLRKSGSCPPLHNAGTFSMALWNWAALRVWPLAWLFRTQFITPWYELSKACLKPEVSLFCLPAHRSSSIATHIGSHMAPTQTNLDLRIDM